MENKCPKCGAKLSIFYLKPVCPECKCDLMYFDMENRLEEDAKKAEAEFEWLEGVISKIKKIISFFKISSIIRHLFSKLKKKKEENSNEIQ